MKNKFRNILFWPSLIAVLIILGSMFVLTQYSRVSGELAKAKELSKEQKYDEAIETIIKIENNWLTKNFNLLEPEIKNELNRINKLKRDKVEYNLGKTYFENGKLEEAEELLSSVSNESPLYSIAQSKLEDVEDEILLSRAVERMRGELEEVRQVAEKVAQNQDVSGAVRNWTSLVTPIRCHWSFLDGELNPSTQGSGILMSVKDGRLEILTNRHVITYGNNLPKYCEAKIPGVDEILDLSQFKTAHYLSEENKDWGTIDIQEIPENAYGIAKTIFQRFEPINNICKTRLEEGTRIAILGYPKIGLENNVTVTTGIISGYENNFYITDATISDGNSGGAAISIEDNCLIGIPTSVVRGETESLGQIRDINSIINE